MKMKQLEALMEVEGVEEESELVMRFPKPYGIFNANENLISVRDASFAWSEDQPPLFEKVDFTIGSRARIAILGKNGCGEFFCTNLLGSWFGWHWGVVIPELHSRRPLLPLVKQLNF